MRILGRPETTHVSHCLMPFSDRLSSLRKQRGLTQEALADLIGITKTQVYRYESNLSQPTLDVIKRLAVTLSVTADELIFEEEERKADDSPKAVAQRLMTGVSAGDAAGVAEFLAAQPQARLDAIWAHIQESDQEKITAAWPKVPA